MVVRVCVKWGGNINKQQAALCIYSRKIGIWEQSRIGPADVVSPAQNKKKKEEGKTYIDAV